MSVTSCGGSRCANACDCAGVDVRGQGREVGVPLRADSRLQYYASGL